MSRLINDDSAALGVAERAGSTAPTQPPLPPERVHEHLKRCQNLVLEQAHASFGEFAKAVSHAFDLLIDQAKTNHEVADLAQCNVFRRSTVPS